MQKYTVTLYIAAPGTPKTKGAPSISGHVYYSISDGRESKGWGVVRLLDSPMFLLQV